MIVLAMVALQAPMEIDLSNDAARQVVVDREKGQYLGHVSTVLMPDGRTIFAVYPKGHGRGAIILKKSEDGGLTWSPRLSVPESWATSLETPTIHRMTDPKTGEESLLVWSGLYPARTSWSNDGGLSWTRLAKVGDWGGIVVMGSVERLRDGRYVSLFHDDGRYFQKGGMADGVFRLYQTLSADGGRTWTFPAEIWRGSDVHLCEPGLVRSPDGKEIAILLRENRRVKNSHVMFSRDEAKTWSKPIEMHSALTGDRHTLRYAPDGKLACVFRDMREGPWKGDFVMWVGKYSDLRSGGAGEMRIRLLDNQDSWDCGYPGLEILPDGTFVATTYGRWRAGEEPFIVSVRIRLGEWAAQPRVQPSQRTFGHSM